MNTERIGALTGLGFVALGIVGVLIGSGEPPNPTDDSAQEIVDFYVDNKDAVFLGSVLQALAATLLVFFAGNLRRILHAAEGTGHTLSAVVLAGGALLALAAAIDATIHVALSETAEDIEPAAVQALSALFTNDFLPLAVGTQVFMLAAGISIVRHGALPTWVGWLAIVIGVLAITPIGFFAFLALIVWILIVSVILIMSSGRASAPPERAASAPTG